MVRLGSGEMFDAIAERYDLLNRILSFGIDRSWRRRTVAALSLAQGGRVLDLATGTGDLAVLIAGRHPTATVVGLDPSPRMLDVGRRKLDRSGLAARVTLVEGDAQDLAFEDGAFDACAIAFGIRNVPDRSRALREMSRVTRAGGRVAVLELTEPRRGPLSTLARFHLHTLVPLLGSLLSGSREYRYLSRSIERFPEPDEFRRVMESSGLRVLGVHPLTFGVACLFVAEPDR